MKRYFQTQTFLCRMTQTPQPKEKFADRNVIAEKAEQDISPEKDFT